MRRSFLSRPGAVCSPGAAPAVGIPCLALMTCWVFPHCARRSRLTSTLRVACAVARSRLSSSAARKALSICWRACCWIPAARGGWVWMEEGGYFGGESAFEVAGARLAPLHVDGGGWSLDGWPSPAPRVICVTPSCHHPLGATMRMEQRLRLLEIAESCNAWIIEDDYDSEYRFQGQPIPAMQGSDASRRVIYVGTFSKLLFPALRIGFMVLPAGLVSGISQAINVSGHVPPLLLQAALFDFLNEGHMAKHLRRRGRLYAMRREAFLTMGEAQLSQWLQWAPGQSGIQTTAFCRSGLDDHAIAAAAKKRGIHVSPLSMQYRHGKPRHGLVLGYAATSVSHMDSGMQKLREALLEVAG